MSLPWSTQLSDRKVKRKEGHAELCICQGFGVDIIISACIALARIPPDGFIELGHTTAVTGNRYSASGSFTINQLNLQV
jgi:hypothetical protein